MYCCRLCNGEFSLSEMATDKKRNPSYCKLCKNFKGVMKRRLNPILRMPGRSTIEQARIKYERDMKFRPEAVRARNIVHDYTRTSGYARHITGWSIHDDLG